jgi:hypothetical protein
MSSPHLSLSPARAAPRGAGLSCPGPYGADHDRGTCAGRCRSRPGTAAPTCICSWRFCSRYSPMRPTTRGARSEAIGHARLALRGAVGQPRAAPGRSAGPRRHAGDAVRGSGRPGTRRPGRGGAAGWFRSRGARAGAAGVRLVRARSRAAGTEPKRRRRSINNRCPAHGNRSGRGGRHSGLPCPASGGRHDRIVGCRVGPDRRHRLGLPRGARDRSPAVRDRPGPPAAAGRPPRSPRLGGRVRALAAGGRPAGRRRNRPGVEPGARAQRRGEPGAAGQPVVAARPANGPSLRRSQLSVGPRGPARGTGERPGLSAGCATVPARGSGSATTSGTS